MHTTKQVQCLLCSLCVCVCIILLRINGSLGETKQNQIRVTFGFYGISYHGLRAFRNSNIRQLVQFCFCSIVVEICALNWCVTFALNWCVHEQNSSCPLVGRRFIRNGYIWTTTTCVSQFEIFNFSATANSYILLNKKKSLLWSYTLLNEKSQFHIHSAHINFSMKDLSNIRVRQCDYH